MSVRALCLAILVVAMLVPSSARAEPTDEDRQAAREVGEQGMKLYKDGEYASALEKLTRAHEIVGLPATGLWRARCLVKLGRFVEASEQYLEVTRMTVAEDALEVHHKAITEAGAEREALLPRLGRVRIVTDGPPAADLVVRIDDKVIPPALFNVDRPIDPGAHQLVIVRGGVESPQPFEVAEGGLAELPIPNAGVPEPVPDRPTEGGTSPLAIGGWVSVGVGAAGLVVGIVLGALAVDRQSTLEDGCTDGDCPPPLHEDVDALEGFRTGAIVGIVVGGALLVGGVTMVLVAPSGDSTSATMTLSPNGVSAMLRF